MSELEKNLLELSQIETAQIDPRQAKMIAEIQQMNLSKPTYGIATSQEVFMMGLKKAHHHMYHIQCNLR